MHIILCIWGLRGEILFKYNYNSIFDSLGFFLFTFTLSVVSASKGLADFLLHGPCKLLPTTGKIDGMGTVGYLLLFLNIAATMVAKGLLLAFGFGLRNRNLVRIMWNWTSFNILPQIIIVLAFRIEAEQA